MLIREIPQMNAIHGKMYADATHRLHPMSLSLPMTEIDHSGTQRIAKINTATYNACGPDPLYASIAVTGYNERNAEYANRPRHTGPRNL
jgi:hypothetical protein